MDRQSRLIPMKGVAGLIIAAGSSSRLGQPKQLLMLHGETLLQRSIRIAHESGVAPVLVALGAHSTQIESSVDLSSASVVVNSGWQEGMASSIRAGIRVLDGQAPAASGVLLMICDQPAVTADHLRLMLAAFDRDSDSAIASVYSGRRGIPALFPRTSYADLLSLEGDQGARGLLNDPSRSVIEIPLDHGEVDIDSPDDLSFLRTR